MNLYEESDFSPEIRMARPERVTCKASLLRYGFYVSLRVLVHFSSLDGEDPDGQAELRSPQNPQRQEVWRCRYDAYVRADCTNPICTVRAPPGPGLSARGRAAGRTYKVVPVSGPRHRYRTIDTDLLLKRFMSHVLFLLLVTVPCYTS